MGALEFRNELQQLKASFEEGLFPKDVYDSMCIDCQRRHLSVTAGTPTPLTALALQRLFYPVCVTVAILVSVIIIVIVVFYEWLQYDRSQNGLLIHVHGLHNMTVANIINHSNKLPTGAVTINNSPEKSSEVATDNSLYYLSTNDGLLSHFFQLEHLWSISHSLNRTLMAVPFHSGNHYPDVEWVSLCDIFELPADVLCSRKEPEFIVKSKDCTLIGTYDWATDPKMYSLPEAQKAVHSCDFRQAQCVAGYIDTKNGFPHPRGAVASLFFPIIKFAERVIRRAEKAREKLGLRSWENITVAHWIGYEFDPDRDCGSNNSNNNKSDNKGGITSDHNNNNKEKGKDKHSYSSRRRRLKGGDIGPPSSSSALSSNSKSSPPFKGSSGSGKLPGSKDSETLVDPGMDIACLPYQDFITYVKANIPKKNNAVTYIATDERNKTILAAFAKAGFKTYVDLKMHDWTTVDNYAVDLIMMAASSHQIFFGSSKYKQFFERIDSQSSFKQQFN